MGWNIRAYVVCLGLVLTNSAGGYPPAVDFSGQLTRWNISQDEPQITYAVEAADQESLDAFLDTVESAAQLWTNVPTSYISLVRVSDSADAQMLLKLGDSTVLPSYSAGFSVIDEVDEEGRMTHCSMQVLTDGSYTAVAKTILHELGHCLGLGHSLVPGAIMSYELQKNRFGLSVDDVAALSRLYPANGGDPTVPVRCGSISMPARAVGAAWCFLMFPLIFLIWAGGKRNEEERP